MGRAARAGNPADCHLSPFALAEKEDCRGPISGYRRHCIRRGYRALRGEHAAPARDLDQPPDRAGFPPFACDGPCPLDRVLGWRPVGRRPLRLSIRPCLFRRKHGQPRNRRFQSRAGLARRAVESWRLYLARLPVPDRSSRLAWRDRDSAARLPSVAGRGARGRCSSRVCRNRRRSRFDGLVGGRRLSRIVRRGGRFLRARRNKTVDF